MTEITREPGESLVEFAKRRAAALGINVSGAATAQAASKQLSRKSNWEDDLVPDPGVPEHDAERYEIDAVLAGIDIIDAYNRWCGKMTPNASKKRESIMVSCPNPAHPDRNPSAWINLDIGEGGVGNCAQCGGFDKFDIAAWHFDFGVPDYKQNFPELVRAMATDLGYTVMVQGKDEWLEKEPPTPAPTPTIETEPVERSDADETDRDYNLDVEVMKATFDWRELPTVKEGTFLHEWMTATSTSYEPEEFYFWEGLMALAAAVGNDVTYDDVIPVRPNLMVCVIGATGTGKSISISVFEDLVRQALPWDDATSSGVKMIASPGSGEALIDVFDYSVTDPNTGQKVPLPVNGLYRENELASFVKRTSRQGSTIREVVMDLYDRSSPVSSTSRMSGTAIARDHFMQMVTSTQTGSIGALLTKNDSAAGFLNRWVFVWGKAKFRPARGGQRIDLAGSIDALRKVRAWSGTGRLIQWHDHEAGEMFDEFYEREIHPLTMVEDAWMAARLPLLAKKMLLIFAINDRSTTVLKEHVETLIAMWDYLLRTYGIVSTSVERGGDDLEDCLDGVLRYMADRKDQTFTVRQLKKQSAAKRHPIATIQRAMDLLRATGMIEELPRRKSEKVPRYRYLEDEMSTEHIASVTPISQNMKV